MDEYCRILIVDDEYIMRRGIRYMMNWEELGCEVIGEASNGKEALDMMEDLKPHIVFCDIAMPVMDGIDFIKIAHSRYPSVQIIILSGYDKFEYVRQALLNGAVDYVLKPTLNPEELEKLLEKTVSKIPGMELKRKTCSGLESQLEQFLKGGEKTLKTLDFAEHFPHTCYRILGFPVKIRNAKDRDIAQVLFEKAEQILKGNQSASYLKFLYSQEFLCAVYNYPLRERDNFLSNMNRMAEQLVFIYEHAFVVMGQERKTLIDLKEDFSNPEFFEADLFYHKGSHVYELSGEPAKEHFDKFDFRHFSAAASQGKYLEAADLFRKYIEKAVEHQMPEYKLKNQTKNLLYNLIGSVNSKIQKLEQIRCEYFAKIDHTVYKEEFTEVFRMLMKELAECLEENHEIQDAQLQEMLDYIAEHYKEEMDLSDLAKNFSFNYSYLSTYFNTRMGEGFSEYLNRIRIHHACLYLEKHEMPISSVSEMVGYSDQSYFCRVFKKITGETPSAYRRRHKSGRK